MIRQLSISNYALIDKLDFRPGAGMSIITGETGAGKSIMLGALSLLLGERADSRVITDKEKKSTVEAIFANVDDRTASKVRNLDAEWDGEELILRREISPSGRSRAFVNDSPVTLATLTDISHGLVDIHSQHNNAILSEPATQLRLVDSVAGDREELEAYSADFRKYLDLRFRIKSIREESDRHRAEREMIAFKLEQLDKLNPKPGELKKIEKQFETLSDAEDIRDRLHRAVGALDGGGDSGALDLISDVAGILSDVDFSLWEESADAESSGKPDSVQDACKNENSGVLERLHQCYIELKDICETLQDRMGDIQADPARLSKLSSRLNEYYSANKRFKIVDEDGLVTLREELRHNLDTIDNGDQNAEELEKEARKIALTLKERAEVLNRMRIEAAERLEGEVEREARELGLPHLRFHVAVTRTKLGKNGGDAIEFQCAINKNQNLTSMARVASGGEIARLMLAIKRVTAGRLQMPTVIFDEIDTGVSGEIADRMGTMMRSMGSDMQIWTITHLPQVAAKGHRHFKVFKEDLEDRTVSNIRLLTLEERQHELARMLSGRNINDAALRNAISLLENNE